MPSKLTTEEFITKSENVWCVNIWDYSNTIYIGRKFKLKLKCIEHNHEFEQLADAHLSHINGCIYCTNTTKTTAKFIEEAKFVWEDKFNYEKSIYINSY